MQNCFFVGDMVWENLNEAAMPLLEGIILMTDFSVLISRSKMLTNAREHLNEMFGKKYPEHFRQNHVNYYKGQSEELAVISYTSGTTSNSKGNVTLPESMVEHQICASSVKFESR